MSKSILTINSGGALATISAFDLSKKYADSEDMTILNYTVILVVSNQIKTSFSLDLPRLEITSS